MEFLQALKLAKEQGLTNEEFREIWLKETDLKLKLNEPFSIKSLTENEKKIDKHEGVPALTVEDSLSIIRQQQEFILKELNHQGTELKNVQLNVQRGNSLLQQSCQDYRNLAENIETRLEKEGKKQEDIVRSEIGTSLKDVEVKVFHMVKDGLSTEGLILQERLSLTLESSINTIVEEMQKTIKSLNHVCLLSETSTKAIDDLAVTIKSELKENSHETVEKLIKGVEQTLQQNLSMFESLPQKNTSPFIAEREHTTPSFSKTKKHFSKTSFNKKKDHTKSSFSNTEKDFPKSSPFNTERDYTKSSFSSKEKDFPKSSPFNTEKDYTKSSFSSKEKDFPKSSPFNTEKDYTKSSFSSKEKDFPKSSPFNTEKDHTKSSFSSKEKDFPKSSPFNTERDHTNPSSSNTETNTPETPLSSHHEHPDGAQKTCNAYYALDEFGVAHVLPAPNKSLLKTCCDFLMPGFPL